MSGDGHRRKLLIVEDDPSLRQILAWGFDDLGYVVCAVPGVGEALGAVARTAFDCALVDYWLPDGTGQALSRRIDVPRSQIVIMSADRESAMSAARGQLAATALIEKPVSIHQLDRFFRGREPGME